MRSDNEALDWYGIENRCRNGTERVESRRESEGDDAPWLRLIDAQELFRRES